MRRAFERQRRGTQNLMAVARQLPRRRSRRRRGRPALRSPSTAASRDVVVGVARQRFERGAIVQRAAARAAYMRSCQTLRSGELRQRRPLTRSAPRPASATSACAGDASRGAGRRRTDRATSRRGRPRLRASSRRRRADRSRTARRACRDRRSRRATPRRSPHRLRRAQAAQRFEPRHRRIVRAAGVEHAVDRSAGDLRRSGRGRAHRRAAHLRVRIARGGTERRPRRRRPRSSAPRARAAGPARRSTPRLSPAARDGAAGDRFVCRAIAACAGCATSASSPCATPSRSVSVSRARRQLDQRPLGRFGLRRGDVRQASERVADRFANVGLRFDFQSRRERRRRAVERGRGRRRA